MRRRAAALALSLVVGVALGGCGTTATPTLSPTGASSPSATPAGGPSQQPRSPVATPPTILALDVGQRPSGPWSVTFQRTGSEAIREVYVLAPACPEPACDIEATIQSFAGDPLGTGVFRFTDGTYRFEGDRRETIDCQDGFGTVTAGATAVSRTVLVIAGYRPAGTAVVSVDIRGTRTVEITPVAGSSCAARTLEYVANGEQTEFAAAPTPTPTPPAPAKVPAIGGSFFGSGAKVVTYTVSGSTVSQIVASIRAHGPWSAWVHTRAEAVTTVVPRYRFVLAGTADSCRIEVTATPAIIFTFTITLPAWNRPKGVDRATVQWWADELQRVATHERHHVEIYRDGATRMSGALAHSTCSNVSQHLAAIVKDIDTAQCEFDLKEYGAALGLTLSSCLNR